MCNVIYTSVFSDLQKENLAFYQTTISPPHFQVVIDDTVYNLPKVMTISMICIRLGNLTENIKENNQMQLTLLAY